MSSTSTARAEIPVPLFVQNLQSDLFKHVGEDTGDLPGFVKKFTDSPTDVDRVNYLYKQLEKYKLLEDWFCEDLKDDLKAAEDFELGIDVKSNPTVALYHITHSMMKAESNDMLLSIYEERSSILFKLKLFRECIENTDWVFKTGGYNKTIESSLRYLRKKAEFALRGNPEADAYQPLPHMLSPSISCVYEGVDKKSPRGVVALKDIKIGEIVAFDHPVSFFMSASKIYHCHHCFKLCYNVIPCLSCTQTVFCGEQCRKQAFIYHQHECPILLTLATIFGRSKVYQLALRTTLLEELDPNTNKKVMEALDVQDTGSDSYIIALTTAIVFFYVKKFTDRFESRDEDAFINSLYINMRVCFRYSGGIFECSHGKLKPVAYALYPFQAVIRHSCIPNLTVSFHGTTAVLRALRTIKQGEECFITYGVDYYMPVKQRQDFLFKKYRFVCQCNACKNNWVQKKLDKFASKNNPEVVNYMKRLKEGKPHQIEIYLFYIAEKMKQLEHTEPSMDLSTFTMLLSHGYLQFGNKRHI